MKTCVDCNCKKNLEEFYRDKKLLDGHSNVCKECKKRDAREAAYIKRQAQDKFDKEAHLQVFMGLDYADEVL